MALSTLKKVAVAGCVGGLSLSLVLSGKTFYDARKIAAYYETHPMSQEYLRLAYHQAYLAWTLERTEKLAEKYTTKEPQDIANKMRIELKNGMQRLGKEQQDLGSKIENELNDLKALQEQVHNDNVLTGISLVIPFSSVVLLALTRGKKEEE